MSDPDHDYYDNDRHDTGLIVMVCAVLLGTVLAGAYAWHVVAKGRASGGHVGCKYDASVYLPCLSG